MHRLRQQYVTFPTRFWSKFHKYFGFPWPGCFCILLWTVAILSFTYFTIRDCSKIITDFRDNNRAIQVDVIGTTESIDMPDLTICVPYYSRALSNLSKYVYIAQYFNDSYPEMPTFEYELMKNESWDIWKTNFLELKEEFSKEDYVHGSAVVATYLLKNILNRTSMDALLTLNQANAYKWKQPLVDAVWYYFSCLYWEDLRILLAWNPEEASDCTQINFSKIGKLSVELTDKLFKLTILALENYFNCLASYQEGGLVENKFLHTESKMLLFEDRFCFSSIFNATLEEFSYTPHWSLGLWDGPFEIYSDPAQLYLANRLLLDTTSIFSRNGFELQKTLHQPVTLTYQVQSSVNYTLRNPCSKESYAINCFLERQFKEAIDKC